MSTRPLADYIEAIIAALAAHDVAAVPGLLVRMTLDGYGHEAESLRRDMLRAARAHKDPNAACPDCDRRARIEGGGAAVQDEVSTCDHAEGMQRTGDMLRTLLAEGGE